MCNFLSGIVLPTGEVITSDYTDSHNDIVDSVGLRDDGRLPGHEAFAPVEFTSDTPLNAESYGLNMDDDTARPDWFTDEMWASVDAELRERIRRMIITSGTRKILLGGTWLLGGGAVVERAVGARIIQLRENSQVGELWENSQVGVLWENSQVGVLRGNSQVGVLRENSQVGVLRENSQVGVLRGNSRVGVLRENSQVGVLWGNSRVGVLRGNSRIIKDNRKAKS